MKKFSKYFFYLLFTGLISNGCQDQTEQQNNLVRNPGFETMEGDFPQGWIPGIEKSSDAFILGVHSTIVHSGNRAMEIGRVWTDNRERSGFRTADPVPLDPSEKYLLSFWYKTAGIDEYPIPLVTGIRVNRDQEETLRYRKPLSTREEWTRIHWILDTLPQDAVSADLVFYMSVRTEGSVFIDDVEFRVAEQSDIAQFEEWRRISAPQATGNAEQTGFEGSGYFRVDNDGTRWWFADPEGRANWAIATMGEIPSARGNGSVELAEWFTREYQGDRKEYARMQYGLLESWGFNSLAGWTAGEFAEITEERYREGKDYLPMFRVLNFSIMGTNKEYYAKDNRGRMKGVHDHSFPDPFNPDWRRDARQKAGELVREFKGDPWFAGWFMDNEVDYSSLFRFVWGDYSSVEFIGYLEKKYGQIETLNEAWTSSFGEYHYASFRDILNDKPEPVEWDDPLYGDFVSFERIMMKEYINYTYDMVKELDPDHLLISNRLNLDPMGCLHRTIDLWDRYDVICVNIYPDNLFMGFSRGELEILDWVHEKTGRPIIIGEWSVPAMDSELYRFGEDPYGRPLDWSWPQVVRNQEERGEVYRTCMYQLTGKPYTIGAAWFKVLDVNSPTRRANRGLINSHHEPYTDLIEVVKSTNEDIKEKMNLPW